jgi:hypothetical protein
VTSEARVASRELPQLPQKDEVDGLFAPHLVQTLISGFPHWAQKLLTGGLSARHFEQVMTSP